MKKILIFFIITALASFTSGCSGKLLDVKKFSPKKVSNVEQTKISGEGITKESGHHLLESGKYLKINDEYYKKCRDEYKGKIENGAVKAINNSVEIKTSILRGTKNVLELSFSAKEKDKSKLIDEINTMLKLNNYEEITEKDFDGIPDIRIEKAIIYKTIGNLEYTKETDPDNKEFNIVIVNGN